MDYIDNSYQDTALEIEIDHHLAQCDKPIADCTICSWHFHLKEYDS